MTFQLVTPHVHTRRLTWRLRETTHAVYFMVNGVAFRIPAGFVFDGASVPFFLWWWISPWRSWVVAAACLHDFGYRHRMFTRKICDKIFYHALKAHAKLTPWRWLRARRLAQALVMYKAVRVAGAIRSGGNW